MNNNTLKKFVEAGYKKKSEAKQIDDYILDEELSTKRNKVYYNPNTGRAIHTIAGTDSAFDWTNNALIPLGMHEYTNRYKNSESIQKKVNKKYGASNVDLVSHSQSGNIAENLANKNLVGGANTTLNPAIIGNHNKNIKVVKSAFDPVSVLTNTNKNDTLVTPKSFNPIVEHSTNILDKTQDSVFKPVTDAFQPVTDVAHKTQKKFNKMFGFGVKPLKKSNVNKSMKDKYDSDSSSDEEMEGMGIDEQKILKKMGSLHKDIAKLHQKHGVKKSVIKGFKALGMGIINGCGDFGGNDGKSHTQGNDINFRDKKSGIKAAKFVLGSQGYGINMPPDTGPRLAVMPQPTQKQMKADLARLKGTGPLTRYRESQKDVTTQDWINSGIEAQKILDSGRVKGYGATGKMLKNAAANATAGLISSGANRAIYEMDKQGKKGSGFKKGSQEAKDHMARIRAMRKTK